MSDKLLMLEIKILGMVLIIFVFFGFLHLWVQTFLHQSPQLIKGRFNKRAMRIEKAYWLTAITLMIVCFIFWIVTNFFALF